MNPTESLKKTIYFFMPYGAIPVYTFPTVRLAMALRDAGYPVKLI